MKDSSSIYGSPEGYAAYDADTRRWPVPCEEAVASLEGQGETTIVASGGPGAPPQSSGQVPQHLRRKLSTKE